MKKFLLAIVVMLLVFWVGVLLFIPSPLHVSAVAYSKIPPAKMASLVRTTSSLEKWWPPHIHLPYHHNYFCKKISPTPLGFRLLGIDGRDTIFNSELIVLPASSDSSIVQWKTTLSTSLNPFERIQQYNRAVSIKTDFQLQLDSLVAFANDRANIYGLDIQITNFKNPFMISTQAQFANYPSIDDVYKTIGKLRAYAQAGSAVQVDSPMVNIEPMDGKYLLRTALPISKKLDATDEIGFKQMVLGKTLLGTTTGGRNTVEQSLTSMQNFITDYRLSSPAIPFQLWVTNRQQQPDSNKWVTKLYFPIF